MSKILLLVLRSLVTASEAALPLLVAQGVIKATQAASLLAWINTIGTAVVSITQELASTDSAIAKTDKIRAIVEGVIANYPGTKGLPSKFVFYFTAIDIALQAVLAQFPATATPAISFNLSNPADVDLLTAIGQDAQTLALATGR